jgi:gluconokinase
LVIVLMGASGAGKTTIGKMLAAQLGWEFADSDDYHSPEKIEKMRNGIPLTDADRQPWLETLRILIANWIATGKNALLACSALKQAYRDYLEISPEVHFVYLKVSPQLLHQRLRARIGHFMTEKMLDSQLATLEEPLQEKKLNPDNKKTTRIVTIDADGSPAQVITEIHRVLPNLLFPHQRQS